jgi:hypothetical protein
MLCSRLRPAHLAVSSSEQTQGVPPPSPAHRTRGSAAAIPIRRQVVGARRRPYSKGGRRDQRLVPARGARRLGEIARPEIVDAGGARVARTRLAVAGFSPQIGSRPTASPGTAVRHVELSSPLEPIREVAIHVE